MELIQGGKSDPPPLAKCAGAVVALGRMIVLVRPLSGKEEWLLPKGHIEGNESAQEAAIREVLEECGVTLNPDKMIPIMKTFLDAPTEKKEIEWFMTAGVALNTGSMSDKRGVGVFPPFVALAKLTYEDQRGVLAAALGE